MSYSWGDDSDSKRVSLPSKGYDYKSARKAYDGVMEAPIRTTGSMRSTLGGSFGVIDYQSRIGKTPPPVGKDISTTSTHPVTVTIDVTGSMARWPGIFFEKLPLMGKEVEHYAPDYAISFCVFGDAHCDKYALQVRDFDVGEKLDEHISSLYPEGNGGDTPEDPQLAAYYYINHCKIDKAVKPFYFIITDTYAHDTLSASAIKKYTGDISQSESLDTKSIFKNLAEKFTVYVLLKDETARRYWEGIFGEQRVKRVEEPRDIVELIIACIADEMGEIKDYEMRSSKRHEDKPDRVERVMKSVRTDSVDVKAEDIGKATKSGDSKKSKSMSMKSKKLI